MFETKMCDQCYRRFSLWQLLRKILQGSVWQKVIPINVCRVAPANYCAKTKSLSSGETVSSIRACEMQMYLLLVLT